MSDILISLGKSTVQLAADLAHIPGLTPALNILTDIIKSCQNVSTNKEAARQLRDRSITLLEALRDNKPPPNIKEVVDIVQRVLERVQKQMETLEKSGRIKAFFKQGDFAKETLLCLADISNCLEKFMLTSHLRIHDWQHKFEESRAHDKSEVIAMLKDATNFPDITRDILACSDSDIAQCKGVLRELISNMQEHLPESDESKNNLQVDLYKLLSRCNELLPDPYLRRGEIQFTSRPASMVGGLEIYQGIYLGKEKVTIKVINNANSGPNTARRFRREADIWRKIHDADRGEHIVPFYGFNELSPLGWYMVSPLQENGTANDYVKKNDQDVDYRQLIISIAEGIHFLHTMDPPVIHGAIQGANIFMSPSNKPLIANFGVSRLIEDVTGAPFTESNSSTDIYRWYAPEVCNQRSGGKMSLSSDVYAFAMTILELMTHKKPYMDYKNPIAIPAYASAGERPPRPSEPRVIERGLDNALWSLICNGWATEVSQRPSIQEMLTSLSAPL